MLTPNRAPSFLVWIDRPMPIAALRFPVAVVLRRTPLAHRWASERWEPIAVEIDADVSAPEPVKLADDAAGTCWRFGGHAIELHRTEAEGYHLNITSPDPKVFVMWRMAEDAQGGPAALPIVVTASYNEAARMLDGGEQVDAVPMPPGLMAWLQPFVAEHYKPEPRKKVRRNDPFRDGDPRGHGQRR
jgi:hypothetical protein